MKKSTKTPIQQLRDHNLKQALAAIQKACEDLVKIEPTRAWNINFNALTPGKLWGFVADHTDGKITFPLSVPPPSRKGGAE